MHRLALSLLLVTASTTAQISSPPGAITPRLPESTAYGLEIIRAEQWHPAAGGDEPDATPNEPHIQQGLADYQALIEALEIEQGPYADQLAEVLSGLGYNYQRLGEHEQAIDSFSRSIHLTRINRGPFAEEQIPLLHSLRTSMLAEAQLEELDQLQEYIYLVHSRALEAGDPRLEQATRDYVQWHRSAYLQDLGNRNHRLLTLYQLSQNALAPAEPTGSLLIPQILGALQIAYLIDFHHGSRQPEFRVRVYQDRMGDAYTAEELRLQRLRETNYRNGLRAAREIVEAAERETPEIRARALVAQGDWYRWQNKRVSARRSYIEAYQLLAGDHETVRSELFAEPTELPDDFIYLPDAGLDKREPRGRARVRFDVNRDGRLQQPEILEMVPEDDRGVEIALRRKLRNLYFRPRLEDGQPVDTEGVEREYIFFD